MAQEQHFDDKQGLPADEQKQVWKTKEEAIKHAQENVIGPYKTENGCTVTLHFAEKSKPGVRKTVANILLASWEQETIKEIENKEQQSEGLNS